MKSDGVEYCCITADKLRLNQILINILSNAVKYTEEGGNITFEIKEIKVTNPQIVKYKFIISDNGIGMSEEYLKDIFKPFTREETSLTDAVQGTGLGMAITKNLIDLMGGTIKVLSTQGVGTTYEELWNSELRILIRIKTSGTDITYQSMRMNRIMYLWVRIF